MNPLIGTLETEIRDRVSRRLYFLNIPEWSVSNWSWRNTSSSSHWSLDSHSWFSDNWRHRKQPNSLPKNLTFWYTNKSWWEQIKRNLVAVNVVVMIVVQVSLTRYEQKVLLLSPLKSNAMTQKSLNFHCQCLMLPSSLCLHQYVSVTSSGLVCCWSTTTVNLWSLRHHHWSHQYKFVHDKTRRNLFRSVT